MSVTKKSKKFYITTAIDYVNSTPHIGHALEKIQADVISRYHRLKGEEVFFLAGTDEHGLKIFRAAKLAGQQPQKFVDENAQKFKQLKDILNLSWDDFIRTTDKIKHWPGAQKLWDKLFETGDLYKKKYQGLYCVGCESFKTEKDLVDGKCPDHQKEPEKVEQENWFFRLSKYAGEIELRIRSNELRIIPETRKNETLSFIESGLEDVSFSRPKKDLPWGIPVPNDPEQNIYVWCDALSNYITAIGYAGDEKRFAELWPADLHVIGKDILRFHTAIWPGMLLSAGLPLPKSIFVHGFITVEGEKMSKTIGNIINPFDLVEKYGIDPVRYYFLREISVYEDGDFSVKKFEERHNGDLANGLGNLLARVTTLGEKISPINFSSEEDFSEETKKITAEVCEKYNLLMGEIKLNEALAETWTLISRTDKYINDNKPWSEKDQKKLREIIINACYSINEIAKLLEPFLPDTAEKIRKQISFAESEIVIKKGEHLFVRLE